MTARISKSAPKKYEIAGAYYFIAAERDPEVKSQLLNLWSTQNTLITPGPESDAWSSHVRMRMNRVADLSDLAKSIDALNLSKEEGYRALSSGAYLVHSRSRLPTELSKAVLRKHERIVAPRIEIPNDIAAALETEPTTVEGQRRRIGALVEKLHRYRTASKEAEDNMPELVREIHERAAKAGLRRTFKVGDLFVELGTQSELVMGRNPTAQRDILEAMKRLGVPDGQMTVITIDPLKVLEKKPNDKEATEKEIGQLLASGSLERTASPKVYLRPIGTDITEIQ